jgi:hypothetical protein
VLIV